MIVSWNGCLVEGGEVLLPVTDAVYLRGEGLFETVRAEDERPLFWGRHYERLKSSTGRMGLSCPESGFLREQIEEVLKANDLVSARVRITLGKEVLVTAEELPPEGGVIEAKTSDCPVNERSLLAQVKCTSYAENLLLLRESGVDEVIRSNTQGELCEGCVSNIFFVKDGQVNTPSLDSGCLPGVMRSVLMTQMKVTEGRWPVEILKEAEEVWLSNAIRRLRFVNVLDGRTLGEKSPRFLKIEESLKVLES